MALDKQRILNELGSVVNQLQNADCGCLGKLFSSPGQGGSAMGAPLPTCGGCRRGCCHGHGYNTPSAGEPYNSMGQPSMGRPCMGSCNPAKLYSDTYNYLSTNLMQPVVKEVYNDLSTLTPANAIANNPMASKMGLSQSNPGNPMMQNNMGGMGHTNMGQPNMNGMPHMGGMGQENMGSMGQSNVEGADQTNMGQTKMGGMGQSQMSSMGQESMGGMGQVAMGYNGYSHMGGNYQSTGDGMGQPIGSESQAQNMSGNRMPMNGPNGNANMGSFGGMGANIVNMMMTGGGSKPSNMSGQVPGGKLREPMLIDAPHSPHGQVGVTPLTPAMMENQGQSGMSDVNNPGMHNMSNMQNPNTQYMMQSNNYGESNATQGNPISGMPQGNMNTSYPQTGMNSSPQQMGNMGQQISNSNPAAQQMSNTQRNNYGQHSQGMAKFNEMFPGVMQGGDLGFDPMAIAIQMNPANQQKSAMDTMNKLMSGKSGGLNRSYNSNSNPSQPATQQNLISNQVQQNAPLGTPVSNQQIQGQQNASSVGQMYQQQNPNIIGQPNQIQQQQQVYTAATGSPMMNQQQATQQVQGQEYPQRQQMLDPNTGALINQPPTGYEGMSGDSNNQIQQSFNEVTPQSALTPEQQMIKEPILPADTSRNQSPPIRQQSRKYEYNTLGQPVEMFPAHIYHTPPPKLPQTLSPQPVPSNLRTNYMKYSNVKNTVSKTSILGNKTPSRNRLQHIYNQYKGSQSYTQQNIKGGHPGTHSDGRLNAHAAPAVQSSAPVERVGGDTMANNQVVNQIPNKVEQVMGQIGDVPDNIKPQGDVPEKTQNNALKNYRNGLQDMVYTSYPTSAAWSFHGDSRPPMATGRYGYRQRV